MPLRLRGLHRVKENVKTLVRRSKEKAIMEQVCGMTLHLHF